jgi:chromosome partitioning protein
MLWRSLHFALVVALAIFVSSAVGGDAASAQEKKRDREVQPPTKLLREYPFTQGGRLRSRERSRARRARTDGPERAAQAPTPDEPADSGSGGSTLVPLMVILGAAALLALGLAGLRVARASSGRRGPAPPAAAPEPAPAPPPAAPAQTAFVPTPPRGSRARSYAVVNQKGGVGKTTVSLTVGVAAARRGTRVLVVDLDPQASATMVLTRNANDGPTMADALLRPDSCSLGDTVLPTEWGVDLAPSARALRSAESGLPAGEGVLAHQLDQVDHYDLVLIDCPPSLGVLTTEVLRAVPRALVVTEPTYLALQAIDELLDTLRDVAADSNPTLEVAGVVVNRVESTAEHKRSLSEVEQVFGSRVLKPHIPKRAVLQDAMRRGVPPQDLPSHYADEVAADFTALAEQLEAAPSKRFAPEAQAP